MHFWNPIPVILIPPSPTNATSEEGWKKCFLAIVMKVSGWKTERGNIVLIYSEEIFFPVYIFHALKHSDNTTFLLYHAILKLKHYTAVNRRYISPPTHISLFDGNTKIIYARWFFFLYLKNPHPLMYFIVLNNINGKNNNTKRFIRESMVFLKIVLLFNNYYSNNRWFGNAKGIHRASSIHLCIYFFYTFIQSVLWDS